MTPDGDARSPWPSDRRRAAGWLSPDPTLDTDPVASVRAALADSLLDDRRLRRLARDPSPHVRSLASRRLAGAPSLLGGRPLGWMARRQAERAAREAAQVSAQPPPKLTDRGRAARLQHRKEAS